MPADTSRFLQLQRVAIAARWLAKLRAALPTESRLTVEQSVDSMDIFLDELARTFDARAAGTPSGCGGSVAREHGRQRHGLGAGLPELVREYGYCYEAIVEVAAERGAPMSEAAMVKLARCLFAAASEAVDEYATREVARQRTSDAEHFAFIAHELRGPLYALQLGVERLAADVGIEKAQALIARADRATALLDQAIVDARRTSFTGQLHIERLVVAELAAAAIDDSAVRADERGVRLSAEVPPGLAIEGDRRLLRSVLANLIENGAKFTRLGSAVTVKAFVSEGRVLIEVRDQCGGLTPNDIERMFEAFQQTRSDRNGFGLGLTLAKQAVEAHTGTLNVISDEGVGCRFVVDLPLPAPPDSEG
jgi:signal transduction histidine kinase